LKELFDSVFTLSGAEPASEDYMEAIPIMDGEIKKRDGFNSSIFKKGIYIPLDIT